MQIFYKKAAISISNQHHYLCSHQPKNCAKPSYCNRNLLVATTQLQKPSDMAAGFLLSSGGKITLGRCPNFRNVALILRRVKKGHGDAGGVTEALQRSSTGLSCGFSCGSPVHRHSRKSTTVTLMKLFTDDEMLFSCFCFFFLQKNVASPLMLCEVAALLFTDAVLTPPATAF